MDNQVQALNAAIAQSYSNFVYDPIVNPPVDIDKLFGQAALFGTLGKPRDVLDLACGTGVQLLRVADQVDGRLVGNDISPKPVEMATERLAQFGDRAEVICRDLLDIDPEELGQFDVIYNLGVIYVVPPPVQSKILELIGKCLRPGGVAVLSYHAGSMPAVRANLHRILSAGLEGTNLGDAIKLARERGAFLAERLDQAQGGQILRTALALTMQQPDIVFLHEIFNRSFSAIQTTSIAKDLAEYGIEFAWYLAASERDLPETSQDRAIVADIADFLMGDYRYPVFARYLEAKPNNFRSSQVRWSSMLKRENPGQFEGEHRFIQVGTAAFATVRNRAPMAMLDCLTQGPLDWSELVKQTSIALTGLPEQLTGNDLDEMETDLRLLWQSDLITSSFIG